MSSWPKQTIHEVAEHIYAVVHGQGEMGVSNATFVVEQERAFVIDTMTFPEMARGMAHEIAQRGAHVDTVLNTHHHIDHMGGNKAFAGARILAHPLSIQAGQQLGFPVAIYEHLMPQFQGHFADLELVAPQPLPEHVALPQQGALLAFTPAHTAADLAVWFPTTRVLIAGDTCFKGVVPLALNGLVSGWIAALDALIALQPTVVVPGHGPLGTLTDLHVLRAYFLTIQRLGREAVQANASLQDALAQLDPGPLAEWSESKRHAINLERVMREARGEISNTNLAAALLSNPI